MSFNPMEDAAKGATKGGLDWTLEQIKSFITKYRNKELVFIEDKKTIETVKEQYNSGELAFYKIYIDDKNMLFLLKMGLTLKKLENEGETERKNNLRDKIFRQFNVNGLHIAQFVENGLLSRYVGILIENTVSLKKFRSDIMNVLNSIEKHVLFVKTIDKERDVIQKAMTMTASNSPIIFIVSGISSAADIVKKCEEKLMELLKDYELEKISSKQRENLFFKRIIRNN